VLSAIDGTPEADDGSGGTVPAEQGALAKVNEVLSGIGATQNRLDFAQENVKTAIVNISAAESTIRDVDMAEEMSRFSKNQILAQAGTAMLAQANQSAQNVLQLLR
jgi:flagellin